MVGIRKRGYAGALVRFLLCALTTLSLSLSYTSDAAPVALLPNMALWALGLCGMWVLYGALMRLGRAFTATRYWLLAALFAGVVTLGQSYLLTGTGELISQKALKSALYFAGRVPLYYALMRLFESKLICGNGRKKTRPLIWSGAILLCWLPWFIMLFPGTVSNDSITQLKQILGIMPLSAGNPIFQTGLIGFFRLIGEPLGGGDAAVALYCSVQAALMAWLLGAVLGEAERAGAPAWLKWGMFAFYALCPVFPVFAFCVGKDTNFAMAVLLMSLSVWRVTSRGEARASDWVCLSLSAVLCVLLRNPGAYLAALAMALVIAQSLIKRNRVWRAGLCALGCAVCVYLTLNLAIIPALDTEPMPETENYSIPLQQVARAAATTELTPEEREAIDAVLKYDQLKDAYNGELSDPVKLLWREDATDEQKRAFFGTWLALLVKHPATCFSASFHNIYGYLYPGYTSTIKPTLLVGKQGRTEELGDSFSFTINPRTDFIKSTINSLYKSPLFRLLASPGLYGWLTLFAFSALRRSRASILPVFPALFTLAGCMLSAVNGYLRYAMPLYLCAPFLIMACACGIRARSERMTCSTAAGVADPKR